MALRNVKLTISYDGTNYHGWQLQPGKRTIQAELVNAVSELLGWRTRVTACSRTDAGVSAKGQVALIQIDSPIPTKNLAKAITDRLPADIAVIEAVDVPMGFNVIGDPKCKLYRYTIFTGRARPVFEIHHCWHLPEAKLDISAMNQAAKLMLGQKDFKSFAAADDHRTDSIRTIFRCDVYSSNNPVASIEHRESSDDWIFIDVEGDRFLYNMVRNIVGTLVEAGVGRMKPEKITEIIEAKNRRAAGPIAPPEGLCLMWIKY
ncbi:MAG: tRNA pseudouridine(38-40) synthase TruA [Sedimentisphaerales bacterium]|nr:tRNA pseudouridine(38-40) synthase TruA [Sedimentisphaerales bacterium]